jgi:gliding motility-associated-like protein
MQCGEAEIIACLSIKSAQVANFLHRGGSDLGGTMSATYISSPFAMIDNFFLAERMTMIAWRLSYPLRIVIVLVLLASTDVMGQYCNCPPAAVCKPCSGGFTKMTLLFNGLSGTHLRIKDGGVVLFDRPAFETMTIELNGTLPDGRFAGPLTVYTVQLLDLLEIYHTSFQTTCGSEFPGESSPGGMLTIVSITSKDGGLVCCAPGTNDSQAPVISNIPTQDIVKFLPSSSCSMQVDWPAPTASDNCFVEDLTSNYKPNEYYFPPGPTTVTYTATDEYGNQSSRSFKVFVVDNKPPTITGPTEIKAPADASCKATVPPPTLTISDNCGIKEVVSDHPSNVFNEGSWFVKYTATDLHGNKAIWMVKVVVEDTTKPVFVTRPVDIFKTATESCKAKVSWDDPKVSDNCSSPQLTSDYDKGDEFPIGETIVTYTLLDAEGNSDTCTFRVVVGNPSEPMIEDCPATITINAEAKSDSTTVTWEEPIATVECGEVSVAQSHKPGSKFPVGITPITYTFTDDAGKSSICEFDVHVLKPDELFVIPKAVTPDGDGINDVWKLSNIENFKSNTVVVIDRWGNKIFHATGYDNERTVWRGTNSNGTIVPTGTYFYTIEVKDQGKVVLKKGFIEVIQ